MTYRDRDTFLKLFNVYVRPHLEYSIQAWCPYTQEGKNLLEKVQKRTLAMVSKLKGKTYEERLADVGMTSLETRRCR